LTIFHFTAAWVVRALVIAGQNLNSPQMGSALREVWKAYNPRLHMWMLRNGELPIWMTYDAIEAIRMAQTAVPIPVAAERRLQLASASG
jgi:hypothetical protein